MTSAIAKVSSTDIIVSVAGRSRESSSRCISTPTTKNSGTVTTSESSGSRPVRLVEVPREVGREDQERRVGDHHHPHDAEVERQPGGQQGVEPAQQHARGEALEEQGHRTISRVTTSASARMRSASAASSGRTIRILPSTYCWIRCALCGRPVLVPAQRADDGVDLVLAQPVDQLLLALRVRVGAADGLDGGGDDLAGGPGVGLVLGRAGCRWARCRTRRTPCWSGYVASGRVAGRGEDALGLVADRLGELGVGRRGREGGHLRLVVELLQRHDQVHGVLVLRAADHDVGLGVGDLGGDAAEVGGVGRVDLVDDGLDAARLELVLAGRTPCPGRTGRPWWRTPRSWAARPPASPGCARRGRL